MNREDANKCFNESNKRFADIMRKEIEKREAAEKEAREKAEKEAREKAEKEKQSKSKSWFSW